MFHKDDALAPASLVCRNNVLPQGMRKAKRQATTDAVLTGSLRTEQAEWKAASRVRGVCVEMGRQHATSSLAVNAERDAGKQCSNDVAAGAQDPRINFYCNLKPVDKNALA